MNPITNAFRFAKYIYDALPEGVSPHRVGFVSTEGSTQFIIETGSLAASDAFGKTLFESPTIPLFRKEGEEGVEVEWDGPDTITVAVSHAWLTRQDW